MLIVIGIIGIIADMTIPTLVSNYKEKVTVIRLKKFYSTMEQAYSMAVAENGTPENWGTTQMTMESYEEDGRTIYDYGSEDNLATNKIIFDNMVKHIKTIKTCEPGDYSCFGGESAAKDAYREPRYGAVLPDGTSFVFTQRDSSCSVANGKAKLSEICFDISVDIHESKSFYWGKDMFRFWVTKYGVVPFGTPNDNGANYCINNFKGGNNQYCAAWVIYRENMDYLKCQDLSWDGKSKCD